MIKNLRTEGGDQNPILGAMALLALDPLTLHHQSVMTKELPYPVAGLDQALHLADRRVWFLMEMLVLILGLGNCFA